MDARIEVEEVQQGFVTEARLVIDGHPVQRGHGPTEGEAIRAALIHWGLGLPCERVEPTRAAA